MKILIIMSVLGAVCCILFGAVFSSPISKIIRSREYCNGESESSYMYNYQNVTDKIYQQYTLNLKLQKDVGKLTVCFGPNQFHNSVIVITDHTKRSIETQKKRSLLENVIACKISRDNEFLAKGFYNCFGNYECMDAYFDTGFFSHLALIIKEFLGKIFNSNVCK
jgi:hypothetical protein